MNWQGIVVLIVVSFILFGGIVQAIYYANKRSK
jgi:hypothetical protein